MWGGADGEVHGTGERGAVQRNAGRACAGAAAVTRCSPAVQERIGEGSFGKVYKGRYKFTGQIVALKVRGSRSRAVATTLIRQRNCGGGQFIPKQGKTKRDIQGLRQEIEVSAPSRRARACRTPTLALQIFQRLDHENIILMLDAFETRTDFCVVTEFAQVRQQASVACTGVAARVWTNRAYSSGHTRACAYCAGRAVSDSGGRQDADGSAGAEGGRAVGQGAALRTALSGGGSGLTPSLQALYYLHSNRILHRDMKPQNILIGADGRVRDRSAACRAHLQCMSCSLHNRRPPFARR